MALVIVLLVLFQKSKSSGLSGTLGGGGGSESFFGKNKGGTRDALLSKLTIVAAIIFVVLTLTLGILELI
jgi:preprotein translocase subunit SecG